MTPGGARGCHVKNQDLCRYRFGDRSGRRCLCKGWRRRARRRRARRRRARGSWRRQGRCTLRRRWAWRHALRRQVRDIAVCRAAQFPGSALVCRARQPGRQPQGSGERESIRHTQPKCDLEAESQRGRTVGRRAENAELTRHVRRIAQQDRACQSKYPGSNDCRCGHGGIV